MLHLFCLLALSLSNLLQPLDASLAPTKQVLEQFKYDDSKGRPSDLLNRHGVEHCVDHVLRQQLSDPTVIAIHKERLLPRYILPEELPRQTRIAQNLLRDLAKDPDKRVWLYSTSLKNDLEDFKEIPGLNTAWLPGAEIVRKYNFASDGLRFPLRDNVESLMSQFAQSVSDKLQSYDKQTNPLELPTAAIEVVNGFKIKDFTVLPASVIYQQLPTNDETLCEDTRTRNKAINYVVDQTMQHFAEENEDLRFTRWSHSTNPRTTVSHWQHLDLGFFTTLRTADPSHQANSKLPDCFAVTNVKQTIQELQDDERLVTISVGIKPSEAKIPFADRNQLHEFLRDVFITQPPPRARTG